MARSIHTTRKDRARERRFSANDGVPPNGATTETEGQSIQKSVEKLNATWQRDAEQRDAPLTIEVSYKDGKLERKVRARKQRKVPGSDEQEHFDGS